MWNKRILLLAISGLLLSAVGCKVRSVIVQPGLGRELNYARKGDTLEFVAYDPNTPQPFYVVFNGQSPCGDKVPYVTVTAQTPGTCKVVSGVSYYSFYVTSTPPKKGEHQFQGRCFPCDTIIVGDGSQLASSQSATAPRTSPDGAPDPNEAVNVSCVSGKVYIDQPTVTRSVGEYVWWYPPTGLTITVPDPICEESPIDPYGHCTIKTGASPGNHTYTIQIQGCASPGTGTITIPTPAPAPAPAPKK